MNKTKMFIMFIFPVFVTLLNASDNNYKTTEVVEEKTLKSWPSSITWFDKEFPKPVVFRGLAKSWQVMEFSNQYLYEKYPESEFLFGIDLEENLKFSLCTADSEEEDIDGFFDEKPEGWPLSFKRFWDGVKNGQLNRYYQNIKVENKHEPNTIPYDLSVYFANLLERDKAMPEMFKHATTTTFFFSGPGSIRMTHSHEPVLLAQIEGRKMITLVPPDEADKLYVKYCKNGKDYRENGKACVSPVNLQNPDLERFPKFKHVHFYHVIVEPGDVIFIPEGWFHEVRALDNSISLSFFYKQTN